MALLAEYRDARRDEDVARIRRVSALRAMVATGMSQRQIAAALGISQPAVSQQLKFSSDLEDVHPEVLLEAAAPVLKVLAQEHGYTRLAATSISARGRQQSRAHAAATSCVAASPRCASVRSRWEAS